MRVTVVIFIPFLILFAGVLASPAQTIILGARETVCTAARAGRIREYIPGGLESVGPVFDQAVSTLRRGADSMVFLVCNGWGADFYHGTAADPFGMTLSSDGRPAAFALQRNYRIYYQKVHTVPSVLSSTPCRAT